MLSVLKSIEAINEKRFPELKPDNSFEMCLLSKEIDLKQISKSLSLSILTTLCWTNLKRSISTSAETVNWQTNIQL